MKLSKVIFWTLVVMTCILVASVMTGCKSIPNVATVTEIRDRVQHDTVTIADSVYVSKYIRERGDTVLMMDTFVYYKYLDKYKYVHTTDSIPYEVQIEVPVRKRNWYDKMTARGFWVLLFIVGLRVGWWVVKKVYFRA